MPARKYIDALTGCQVTIDGHTGEQWEVANDSAPWSGDTIFFPGCALMNFAQDLMDKAYWALAAGIKDCGISLVCCGKVLQYEPDSAQVKASHEQRLATAFLNSGARRIITACPNCAKALRRILSDISAESRIEVVPLPQAFHECGLSITEQDIRRALVAKGSTLQSPHVAIHDSCPDRAVGEFADSVRSLLPASLITEMEHSRNRSLCCGSPLRGAGKYDEADQMARRRCAEGVAAHADAIITSCINCARQLDSADSGIVVLHYLEMLFDMTVFWKETQPYMQIRFLFDDYHSERRKFLTLDHHSRADAPCPPGKDGDRQ